MVLQFLCPNGHKIHCPEERAGQPARCPKCGIKFRVPTFEELDGQEAVLGKATNGDSTGSPGPVSKSRIGKGSTAVQNQIEFLCPNGHLLHGAASLQGRAGMCPECGAKFRIPIIEDMPSSDGVSPLSGSSSPAAPASVAGLNSPLPKAPVRQLAPRPEPRAPAAQEEDLPTEFAPPQDFELSQDEPGSYEESDSVGEFDSLKDLFGADSAQEPVAAKPAKPQESADPPPPAYVDQVEESPESLESPAAPEVPEAVKPADPSSVADQPPAPPASEPSRETAPVPPKAEESPASAPPLPSVPATTGAPCSTELSSLSVVGIPGASAVGAMSAVMRASSSSSPAALMERLWALKTDSATVEVAMADGRQIVPVRFLQAMSQGTHGVFAVTESEGGYSLMAIAWDMISTIVVKGLKELPPE